MQSFGPCMHLSCCFFSISCRCALLDTIVKTAMVCSRFCMGLDNKFHSSWSSLSFWQCRSLRKRGRLLNQGEHSLYEVHINATLKKSNLTSSNLEVLMDNRDERHYICLRLCATVCSKGVVASTSACNNLSCLPTISVATTVRRFIDFDSFPS